eukprot:4123883-Pleurochrysis_carterae.AAC.2
MPNAEDARLHLNFLKTTFGREDAQLTTRAGDDQASHLQLLELLPQRLLLGGEGVHVGLLLRLGLRLDRLDLRHRRLADLLELSSQLRARPRPREPARARERAEPLRSCREDEMARKDLLRAIHHLYSPVIGCAALAGDQLIQA